MNHEQALRHLRRANQVAQRAATLGRQVANGPLTRCEARLADGRDVEFVLSHATAEGLPPAGNAIWLTFDHGHVFAVP